MSSVGDLATKVRSKNAGPFWLTIDIFCGTAEAFALIGARVDTATLAALFQTDEGAIKRFDISDLNVVKFSLPRPTIQGARDDRDMHGAGWASLVAELTLA